MLRVNIIHLQNSSALSGSSSEDDTIESESEDEDTDSESCSMQLSLTTHCGRLYILLCHCIPRQFT